MKNYSELITINLLHRMAFFDKDLESEEHVYQKYPIRRLEPSIKKFLKVIDIDLGRLHQHKMNIEKVSQSYILFALILCQILRNLSSGPWTPNKLLLDSVRSETCSVQRKLVFYNGYHIIQ